ncbi:MAG TPA: radical SAM protein [Candidatus Hydrogenedentes bacterium]|nr:radical SAM protein [Candidatus Hydrogenedentota bacterium]HPC18504.1 radical SAM protein [Candidatus Hydrogenedentota bacterium]HRT63181.1 radical SAM protein [Candidatus Hydrogenedentota bacterium]
MDLPDNKPLSRRLVPAGRLFGLAQRLYTDLPMRLLRNGYALPPWQYIIELTRRCNLQCRMCLNAAWRAHVPADEQRDRELAQDEWRAVIDQIPAFRLISFTGGEVFIRTDFPELLEYAGRRHFTHVMTNLTTVSEDHAALLARLAARRLGRLGLMVVGTSIDGPAEVHDRIRGLPGAFNRTVETMRRLLDARKALRKTCPRLHMTAVIQRDNARTLAELPRIAKQAGADELLLLCETRSYDLRTDTVEDPAAITRADIPWPRIDRDTLRISLLACMDSARAAGIRLRLPRMPMDDLLDYYDGVELPLDRYTCRSPWYMQGMDCAGYVGSCGYGLVGNVRDTPLAELWNGARQRRFRQERRGSLLALCPGCCFMEHRETARWM